MVHKNKDDLPFLILGENIEPARATLHTARLEYCVTALEQESRSSLLRANSSICLMFDVQKQWKLAPLRQGFVFMQTFSLVRWKQQYGRQSGTPWLNATHNFNYVFNRSWLFAPFLRSFVHPLGFFGAGFSGLLHQWEIP